jgi:hypothetical protein
VKAALPQESKQNASRKVHIPFWTKEEQSIEQSYQQLTTHEVKYDYTDPNSNTHKVSIYSLVLVSLKSGLTFRLKNSESSSKVIDSMRMVQHVSIWHALSSRMELSQVFNDWANKPTENKKDYKENKADHILCLSSVTENDFLYQALQSLGHPAVKKYSIQENPRVKWHFAECPIRAMCDTQSILNFGHSHSGTNFVGINWTTISSNSHLLAKTRRLWKTTQLSWFIICCLDIGSLGCIRNLLISD